MVDGYGRSDQLQDNIFRQLTLGLTIPIFNGYQSKAAYQRSVINQKLAAVSAKEVDNTLRQNVETAYNEALWLRRHTPPRFVRSAPAKKLTE